MLGVCVDCVIDGFGYDCIFFFWFVFVFDVVFELGFEVVF